MADLPDDLERLENIAADLRHRLARIEDRIRLKDVQWQAFQKERTATLGVIVGGESNMDDVPERLKGDALRSSREAGCKQKGPVARAADTGSFVGSNPIVVHSVDWLGLALHLEAQAKRVESQTAKRAMLAGAHGLRLMGAAGVAPSEARESSIQRDTREIAETFASAPLFGVVGINGLTEAETSATASVMGIVGVNAPDGGQR